MKRGLSIIAVLGCLSSCQSNTPKPPQTSSPVQSANPADKRFDDPNSGISFMYPSDWKSVSGTKSQLKIAATDGGQLTLDIPVLPFHIPGMIPIDQVRNGYVDDAKKKMPDATATDLPNPTLPSAQTRWVKLSGHQDGKSAINEAVLIVHGDHVFILSIDADDHSYDHMHSTLQQVIKSLQWTK